MSKKEQSRVKSHLQAMMYAENRDQALRSARSSSERFGTVLTKTIKTVVENWEALTTYYDYPREHWKTPADIQHCGVTLFAGATANRSVAKIQIADQRDLPDLEDDDGGGEEL